jgi:hypothetical protein
MNATADSAAIWIPVAAFLGLIGMITVLFLGSRTGRHGVHPPLAPGQHDTDPDAPAAEPLS